MMVLIVERPLIFFMISNYPGKEKGCMKIRIIFSKEKFNFNQYEKTTNIGG